MKNLFSVPKMKKFGLNQSLKGMAYGTLMFVGTSPLPLRANTFKNSTKEAASEPRDALQDLKVSLNKLSDKIKKALH